MFTAFAVVLVGIWLKLESLDPGVWLVKPVVAGLTQVNTLPVNCVLGVTEIGLPLLKVSYLVASEVNGVG